MLFLKENYYLVCMGGFFFLPECLSVYYVSTLPLETIKEHPIYLLLVTGGL